MIAQTLCALNALNINVSNKAALIQPAKSENVERLFCEVVSMVSRNWTTRTSIHCRQMSSMHKHMFFIFFHLCGKKTKSRKARQKHDGLFFHSSIVNDFNELVSASIVHRWGQVVEVVDMPRLGRRDVVEVVNMPLVFPLGSILKSKVKVNPSHSWRRLYKPLETKARLAARHVACINVTVALKHVESCYYHTSRFFRSCKFHWWNSKTWEAWSAPKDRANEPIPRVYLDTIL